MEMIGHGGRTKVAALTGMSRATVIKGAEEIVAGAEVTDRIREEGAGDKPAVEKQPGLWEAIDKLVGLAVRRLHDCEITASEALKRSRG